MTTTTAEINGLSAAFVGRGEEWELLEREIERAEEGAGAVVLVAAEEGLGKTRLAEEALRYATKRGLRTLCGVGDEQRSRLTYGIFADVLADYMQTCGDGEREELRGVVAELAPHLWNQLFAEETRPELGGGEEMRPQLRQSLFLARMARLVLQAAKEQGLLLVLDDMHWADSGSLMLLRQLASRCADMPLVVLVAYEPGAQEVDGSEPSIRATALELQRQTHVQALELSHLDLDAMSELVAARFPGHGFSEGMVRMIHFRSGGSPLFALQYLEDLREKEVVYQEQGTWVNGEVEEAVNEPDTVRAALHQRLQRLSGDERLILGHSALQGELFTGRMAARTLEWPLPRVLRTLSQLLRRTRMLRIEEERFCFVHPLLAEVCAEFLSAADRRTAHLRLGTIIEERQGDPEELAFHFYRAGALKRALAHLLKAAQRARNAFAYAEAQRFLEQAQEAVDSQDGAVSDVVLRQLLLQRAEIEDRLGRPDEALTLCQRVLRDGDRRASARALMQMGWTQYRKGDWRESMRLYDSSVGFFAELGDEVQMTIVYVRMGLIYFERGELDEAVTRFNDAKALAVQCGEQALLGTLYGNLGVIDSIRGRYVEAVLNYSEALKAYRQVQHSYGVCQTFHNLGMTHADQEQWQKALQWYGKAEEMAREMGTIDVEANVLVSAAVAHLKVDDLEACDKSCLLARRHMEQLGDRPGVAECNKVEGMALCKRGEYALACERLQTGRHLFSELDNALGAAECAMELGRLELARGEGEQARPHFAEAERTFAELGAEDDARRAAEALAQLAS